MAGRSRLLDMHAVSDTELLHPLLTPPMERYLARKLPALAADELRRRVAECLKGLTLMSEFPGTIYFSGEIDDIWHCLILETRAYADLCARLPGGMFLHHSSADYADDEASGTESDDAQLVARLTVFFASYVRHFGPMAGDRVGYWPLLRSFIVLRGWDLDSANGYFARKSAELEMALRQAPG